MRLSPIAQNPLEWMALQANLAPVPLAYTQVGFVLSHAIMDASDLGIFDALEAGPQTTQEIAQSCQLHPGALQQLLQVLCSLDFIRLRSERYRLTRISRKWLLKSSPDQVGDLNRFNSTVVWNWMNQMKDYLRTGKGIQYHDQLTTEEWSLYQKAMQNAAMAQGREVAKKTPMPPHPTRMLDIGGSHGAHSAALCKRYGDLRATILDLPQAIEQAAPLLAKYNLGDRVVYQAGNVLSIDLGENLYDLILESSLAHHFTREQNQEIAIRVTRALKPGGMYVIQEFLRPGTSRRTDMIGSVLGLFYGLTSASGTWSKEEIREWQQSAGLQPVGITTFISLPGFVQVVACKKN
ncbi:MAG: class I SAM-dependent methyltransferase [Chitinophagaceae bacterium]